MAVMTSDGPSHYFPSLRLGLPAPQPSRRHHAQSLLGLSFHDPRTHHVFKSHSEQAAPLYHRDDERRHAVGCHSAIWSLSPQQFHGYFYLSIVSWQYQKYSTILILVLCLLCVTPLVCSSYSSFVPSSPFFSSWWHKDCDSFNIYTCSPMFRSSPLMS